MEQNPHQQYQRRTMTVIVSVLLTVLKIMAKHYPIVFALVTVAYLPIIRLDYVTYNQIGDCEAFCQPGEESKPQSDFANRLTTSLNLMEAVAPYLLEPIRDNVMSHGGDSADHSHTTAFPGPFAQDHPLFTPILSSPIPVPSSTPAQSPSTPPTTYKYHRQQSVMKCLEEKNDCDVMVAFKAADLSSLPPLTDAKYWPKGKNTTDGLDLESYKLATQRRTADLINLLQSHALNATRSVKYLIEEKLATIDNYLWIHPTIRVHHMTKKVLSNLEHLQELQSLEMSLFTVSYTSSSVKEVQLKEAVGVYNLDTTLCPNCYLDNGVTRAPCVIPGHVDFKKMNCRDAINKGVQFNCDLMRNRGKQYCNDAELPEFESCDQAIAPGEGRANMIEVPKMSNVLAPDYLVNLLGSEASKFLTPTKYGKVPVIASFDSGVSFEHEALRESYRGYTKEKTTHKDNWFSPFGDQHPVDVRNHGTAVLSVALGGYKEDDKYKCLGATARSAQWIAATCDSGDPSQKHAQECYLKAFQWLLDLEKDGKGADVVLMPIIDDSQDGEMFLPIYNSIEKFNTTLFVTSLGKPKASMPFHDWCHSMKFPASFDNVITVGAVSSDMKHSACNAAGGFAMSRRTFENIQMENVIKPDLVTYGEGIMCAVAGAKGIQFRMTGTSFSAGLMAGVLAHFRAKYPLLKLPSYREAFKTSCINVQQPESKCENSQCPLAENKDIYFGAGLLNATALDGVLSIKHQAKVASLASRDFE